MVPSHNRHWQIQFDKYKIAQVLWRSLTTNKFEILEQGFPYFFAGKCRHPFSGSSSTCWPSAWRLDTQLFVQVFELLYCKILCNYFVDPILASKSIYILSIA